MANNSSVIVNELRNSSYTNADVLKFHLNDNLQLLNPKETYFRFNLTVGTAGADTTTAPNYEAHVAKWAPWFMDTDVASEALVKSIRVVSRKDGTVLEEITDYNLLAKKIGSYTHNSSVEEMKKLYYGADTADVRSKNTLTSRANVPVDNITQSNSTIECFLKLSLSGIFGDKGQLFPCFACPLELQVELESDTYKVIRAQGARNAQGETTSVYYDDRDNYSKSVGYSADMGYAVAAINGGAGTVSSVDLTNTPVQAVAKADKTAISTGPVNTVAGATAGQSNLLEFPFSAGQEVNVRFVGATSGGANEVVATIKKVSITGTSLRLEFQATIDVSGDGGATAAGYLVYVKTPSAKPDINITDVELICGIVKPDEAMIKKYQSAMSGGQGMGMAIQSYYDYPVNSSANALVISNLINCKLDRVKSIFSFWENVSDGTLMYADNLRTQNDTAVAPRQYVYKLDGLQTPSRAIPLTNVQRARSTGAGWWSAQQLRETTQALKECGFSVRDLSKSDVDFMIGRALTRFPNTYSLKDLQGELRLDLQFTANTKNLLHHNYVCYTKTLFLSPTGVKVLE